MSKIQGRLISLGIAKEVTRGLGAAPVMWLPHTEFNLINKVDKVRDESAFGNLADVQDMVITEKYSEGDISGELRDQTFGYFLLAYFGAVSSAAQGVGYKHTFTWTDTNTNQSLSLIKKDAISTEMYKLAMIKSLDIKAALNSFVNFTAGIMAKVQTPSTGTPSFTAENKFSKKHIFVKVADDIAGLTSATALNLKTLDFKGNKNVSRDSAMGTVQPLDILNGTHSAEVSFTLNYEDTTFRDYLLNGTFKAMEIMIENGDVDLGGGVHPSVKFQFPRVEFDCEPNYALEEIISQTVTCKCHYDLTNLLKPISLCELVNAKASYAA